MTTHKDAYDSNLCTRSEISSHPRSGAWRHASVTSRHLPDRGCSSRIFSRINVNIAYQHTFEELYTINAWRRFNTREKEANSLSENWHVSRRFLTMFVWKYCGIAGLILFSLWSWCILIFLIIAVHNRLRYNSINLNVSLQMVVGHPGVDSAEQTWMSSV